MQQDASLNPAQQRAVEYLDGPLLIVAGAGSGKTRVLTYKIAYLLSHGYRPWEILALTFTNKAAREMNERIEALVGDGTARWLWSGTFHSIFARLLRIEHAALGISEHFTIYDEQDSRNLIKNIVQELIADGTLDKDDDKKYKPADVHHRISRAKNLLMLPEHYAASADMNKKDQMDGRPIVSRIYAIYQARLRGAEAMDFDDLLMQTFYLLYRDADVRRRWQERFRYVLVDEYQDTNVAQHRILRLLIPETDEHLCVVGDDAQSIYAFRGAEIKGILSFTQQYRGAVTMKLERNYRSTQTIVAAASSLIRHNRGQIPKNVYSEAETGEPIRVIATYSDREEAAAVVSEIRRLMHADPQPIQYDDIAILYRTNAQSRALETALKDAAIPYRIFSGLSFYARKEIRDVIAYFRLITNHQDAEAFRRIVNYPARKIGATSLEHLFRHALSLNAEAPDPWQALQQIEQVPGLNRPARERLSQFRDMIERFAAQLPQRSAYDMALWILEESGVAADLAADRTPEGLSRRQNVDELLSNIKQFEDDRRQETITDTPDGEAPHVDLTDYLLGVALLTSTDNETPEEREQPHVTLTSCHGAKGLEFAAVIVTGMEQELFPGSRDTLSPTALEEERRLCYVAMTRAKRHLIFTHAAARFRFGQTVFSDPSQFIAEIDPRFLIQTDRRHAATYSTGGNTYGTTGRSVGANDYLPNKRTAFKRYERTPQPAKPFGTAFNATPQPTKPFGTAFNATPQPTKPFGTAFNATPQPTKPAAPPSRGTRFAAGMRVEHTKFGTGTIRTVIGTGDDQKVVVDFPAAGTKTLLVRFARLTVTN